MSGSKEYKFNLAKASKKLTPQILREYEGFEEIDDKEAEKLILHLTRFAEIVCKQVQKELKEDGRKHSNTTLS